MEGKKRGKRQNASSHSVLLVLWCRVIFSNDGEQRAAVEAVASAAAPPFLTATLCHSRGRARETSSAQQRNDSFLKSGWKPLGSSRQN